MRLLLYLILCIGISSCKLFNPDEMEPCYINIPDFSLTTLTSQGTNSNAISEMWVYVNADVVGVYDTPAEIPVLKTGNNTVTVFAGIKNNGMGSSRIRYPFYASYDTIINLQPMQQYTVNPKFTYLANAQINNDRNFEGGNNFQGGTNNTGQAQLITDSNIAADGINCLKASLTSGNTYMQFIDNLNLVMTSGNTVFLEMDYSCNNTFIMGVYTIASGSTTKEPILYLTPTNEGDGSIPTWNKVYIDMGAIANVNPNADYYRIYFESTASESSTPTVYLDNLKIVNW